MPPTHRKLLALIACKPESGARPPRWRAWHRSDPGRADLAREHSDEHHDEIELVQGRDRCRGARGGTSATGGPAAARPEMKNGLAKAAEGPDQLRPYGERNRTH